MGFEIVNNVVINLDFTKICSIGKNFVTKSIQNEPERSAWILLTEHVPNGCYFFFKTFLFGRSRSREVVISPVRIRQGR